MKTRLSSCWALLLALALVPEGRGQVLISFDYSYDANNFFSGANVGRRAYLESAAGLFEAYLKDTLNAITPGGGLTWNSRFWNPSADSTAVTLTDAVIPANTLVVYVGGQSMSGTALAWGAPGGYLSAFGNQAWFDNILARGETGALATPATDFGPWGGSISFNSGISWYFDSDVSTKESFPSQIDFYSVTIHEMGHVLGFGSAPSWKNWISGANFTGPASTGINNGPVSLNPDKDHWNYGTLSTLPGTSITQETAMDPDIGEDTRKYFTALDWAGLQDTGWEVVPETETYALIAGLGLLGFVVYRRTTRKAAV